MDGLDGGLCTKVQPIQRYVPRLKEKNQWEIVRNMSGQKIDNPIFKHSQGQ